MKYFAKLDVNNVIVYITPVLDETCLNEDGDEDCCLGEQYCRNFYGDDSTWIHISYDDLLGRNVLGAMGKVYIDQDACQGIGITSYPGGIFVDELQPYDSWTIQNVSTGFAEDSVGTLVETFKYKWMPPVEEPSLTREQRRDGSFYEWLEDRYQSYIADGSPELPDGDTLADHVWILRELY